MSMIYDVKCPYCGKGQEICHDDGVGYSEDKTHQQECSDCEKIFIFTTSITFYYEASEADCLNDGKHTFEKVGRYPVVIFDKVCVRCSQCQEEKDVDYKEAFIYGYDQNKVNLEREEEIARYNKGRSKNDK